MLQHACCNEKMKDYALLALRIAVGVIFIYQGWLKLNNIEFVTTMFDEVGIPLAGFFAYLVAIVEFLGGIAVLVGFYTSGFALLLAIIMVVALLVVHVKGPFIEAIPALSLLGSTLALKGLGAGKFRVSKEECFCTMKEKKQ